MFDNPHRHGNNHEHRHGNRHEHRNECDRDRDHDHDHKHADINCPVVVQEDINITVPVSIHAHADVDEIFLRCAGHNVIKESHGRHRRKIKIKQKVELCIPINFMAECNVDDEHVEFDSN